MLALFVLFFLATADRLSKLIAVTTVTPPRAGFVVFESTLNTGGPLGWWVSIPLVLVLTVFIGGGALFLTIRQKNFVSQLTYGLLALGIFSNGYDRLVHGGVIDTFRLIGGLSFNLADIYIVAAVLWLVSQLVIKKPKTLERA